MERDKLGQYQKEYSDWLAKYSPMEYLEYDGEDGKNFKEAQSTPSDLIWTAHGTCEDNMVSSGFHFFGDPPRCCWDTYGWHISKTSSGNSEDDYESYKESFYCECECYDEETESGKEGCENCYGDGWRTEYFD